MRRKLAAVLAALATALGLVVGAAPAQAINGGTADGDEHPGVAFIGFYTPQGFSRCSAALVAPTVLLTAGHCTASVVGKVLVSFDSVIAEQPPSGLPRASSSAAGYTAGDIAAGAAAAHKTYYSGTATTHPAYSGFTDTDAWNDLGVVVLDTPATGVPTYPIARVGTFDAIRPGDIPKTIVRAVGYGTQVGKPASGPQVPTQITYPLVRRYADMPLQQKVDAQIVVADGNEHDARGTGGICNGDSGGPVFLDGEIAGVVSFGRYPTCRYQAGIQRVDIAAAQNWLVDFGVTAG
jgi:secreted trypsin-like serine protease